MPPLSAFTTFVGFLDVLSVAVFAVTGALMASRKQMDIFGFALLGTVTGVGGGTVRDVLLGTLPVFWVKDPIYVMVALAVSVVVYFTAHIPESRYRLLLWLDAVGLSLVAVIGADRGLEAGAGAFVAIVMGVVTAVFGGIIRDILGGESPVILRREIYVIPALIGAVVFVLASRASVAYELAASAGFIACFTVRALALARGWSLPPYRARAARSIAVVAPEPGPPRRTADGSGGDRPIADRPNADPSEDDGP